MAVIVGCFLFLLAVKLPSYAVAVWLGLTVFLPDWASVSVRSVDVHPLTAVGLPVIAGLVASGLLSELRWTWVDVAMCFAGGSVSCLVLFFDLATFTVANVMLILILSYVLGRLAGPDAGVAFVVVMTVVAVWGISEFASGIHLFESFDVPSGAQQWNQIQERAGLERPEASLGHAIAYGASLAMAIPFTYRWRRGGFAVQLILAAGAIVSLSRGPMLALLATMLLCTLIMVSGRMRVVSLLVLAIVSSAVYLVLGNLYSGASSTEVRSSSNARVAQLDKKFGSILPIGSAPGSGVTRGDPSTAGVTVIDSTPLRLAVNYGWVIAVCFLSPVVLAGVAVLKRRKSAAAIALVGQIPVLLVTSLITQWQGLLFFVAGMAVTELSRPASTVNARMDTQDAGHL